MVRLNNAVYYPVPKILPVLLLALFSASAHSAENVEFDTQVLQSRGLSLWLNDYFKQGKRFPAGNNTVEVSINGVVKTRLEILFNAKGDACLKPEQLTALGLHQTPVDQEGCADLRQAWPQTEITAEPNKSQLAIVVPETAIAGEESADHYQSGGVAGIFNYDLLMMRNKSNNGGDSDTVQAGTEAGFNADDWIVRSRQSTSYSDDERSNDFLYAWAQRTLTPLKTVVQGGKISINNSLFAAPQILGVQFSPESGLNKMTGSGASVSGIAQSQARVEVRQSGALIYSTIVPTGAFNLTRLPTISNTADLTVTVIEQDNSQRSFVVPASSFAHVYSQQPASFSGAVGQIPTKDNEGMDSRWLMTLSATRPLGERANFGYGALLAENYQSLAAQAGTGLASGLSLNAKLNASDDQRSNTRGEQGTLSASQALTSSVSVNASATRQNRGYRDLTDSDNRSNDDDRRDDKDDQDGRYWDSDYHYVNSRYESQYNAGISYSQAMLGAMSLSWSQSAQFDETEKTNRWLVNWSKSFVSGVSVSVNAEKDTGADGDTLVYASISIPMGSVRLGANMSRSGGSTRSSVTADQQINDTLGYSINATHDSREGDNSAGGTLHVLPKYSQLNVGYSQYGAGNNSSTFSASGGVAVHKEGVLFSPYAIGDTLAVMKVGNLSGTKIDTPQGSVWTNGKGYAVAPGMTAFGDSRLTLQTESLPKNIDIKNGVVVSEVSRGSVTEYNFGVVESRRALVRIMLPGNKAAQKGDVLVDDKGNYVTTVAGDSTVFLVDDQLKQTLWLTPQIGTRCKVMLTLNEKINPDELYENYDAQCRP